MGGRTILQRAGLRIGTFAALLFMLGCSGTSADEMTSTIVLGSSRVDVSFDPGPWQLSQQQLLAWVQHAAEAVAAYYGRYPRPRAHLRILPFHGHGVHGGQTFGSDGGFIRIRVGIETTAEELARDWMLTHEMVHLAFPSMDDQHHWLEEGLATYVEPIARIQAGQMTSESMWSDLVRDMPKGQPEDGDLGLDHTHTWGRTYWGGALFCFVADVEIRKKTRNLKGLQDAMRAILDAGGDITEDWSIEKALKAGDSAVGASVLWPLYFDWRDKPAHVDLATLWAGLGVLPAPGGLQFDDKAPLAAIRKAITAPGAPAHPLKGGTSLPLLSAVAGRRFVPR